MLVEFSVGNYRSFKNVVTLSMVAAKIKAQDSHIDQTNVGNIGDDIRLLKSVAIYGANASGKSNLTKAFSFMRKFVLNSSKNTQAAEPIEIDRFQLNAETETQPSFFEIVFLLEGKRYRYGFEVNNQAVISEWLFYTPNSREAKLFTRQLGEITITPTFKEGRKLSEITRDNALFLSVAAQFNGFISGKILDWFRNINVISGLDDIGYILYTIKCLEQGKYFEDIISFVKNLDLNVEDIRLEENKLTIESLPKDMPEEIKKIMLNPEAIHEPHIRTIHKKYNADETSFSLVNFDMRKHESEGTAKLFALAGPLIDTLKNGKVLIVDELDARLHPLITSAIIKLFNSIEGNPNNAQLIFTTHDTNLLSNKFLRRDQVWFTEKNSKGVTDLYSLVEYNIRNDASFESDYIKGRYGAIPFLGDVYRLLGVEDE